MGVCGSVMKKGKMSFKSLLNDEKQYNDYSDKVFEQVDTNKNGYLEKDELKKLIEQMVNKFKKDVAIPEDKVKSALELIDTDKDGKISKEEFRKTSRTKLLAIVS